MVFLVTKVNANDMHLHFVFDETTKLEKNHRSVFHKPYTKVREKEGGSVPN